MIEILIVSAIILVLVTMIVPAIKSTIESSRSIRCTSNLKMLTSALFAYAGDHNGNLPHWYDAPNGAKTVWMKELSENYTYAPPRNKIETAKQWCCPSWEPRNPGPPFNDTYGMVTYTEMYGDNLEKYRFRLSTLNAQIPLLADSINMNTKSQCYYIMTYGPGSKSQIHLRHNGRANISFGDGHVAGMTAEGLKGITNVQYCAFPGGLTNFSTYRNP